MSARYQIQVRGEWAGSVGDWRPAVDGAINQTGLSAVEASTCETHDEAEATLDNVILPELRSDGLDVDNRRNAPEFRIVEVPVVSDKRFTGSVSIGAAGGQPMLVTTEDDQVILTTPSGEAFTTTEDEAWCLARQLDLACRRVRRTA